MAEPDAEVRRAPTTYMSKDGYALPIKAHKHEASGLRPHAKAYIRRNQKISRLAKQLLPAPHPDADVPLRSRARHLRPTRRHDDFSTTHKPVRWYEQKSFSRSQKYATREVRRRALSETHPVPLMGVHTPFHGARYAPAPCLPELKHHQARRETESNGQLAPADTPRCAEMHLAELAYRHCTARQRDEASRLEKLKEEKARADAEFRRCVAAQAAGLPSTVRDAVGPFPTRPTVLIPRRRRPSTRRALRRAVVPREERRAVAGGRPCINQIVEGPVTG